MGKKHSLDAEATLCTHDETQLLAVLEKKTKRFLGNFHRGNGKVSIGVVTVVMSLVEYRVKSMASSLYLNL